MSNHVQTEAPRDSKTAIPARTLFLVGALLALLTGLNAAALRLGVRAPLDAPDMAAIHGILMVYGFLGTAILLERSVALRTVRPGSRLWAYVAPAASGVAVVVLVLESLGVLPGGRLAPALLWGLSFTLLLVTYVIVWQIQPSIAVLIQLLGALAGMGGILLWGRGYEVAQIVPWWAMFLVLTIVGERLELARIAFLRAGTETRILFETCAVMVSLLLTMLNPELGYPLLGAAAAVLIVDVAWNDVARKTIFSHGLTRFMAACMLAGYGWALVGAGIWIVKGPVFSGYAYDAVIHSLTIGFALSMVFAHAPVIVPAIARRSLPYSPVMWTPWALLQLGLIMRILAGARGSELAWQFGGSLDVIAVVVFVLSTLALIVISAKKAAA